MSLHFLRPQCLVLLLPALGLIWLAYGQQARSNWHKVVAPHLLKELLSSAGPRSRLRAHHILAGMLLPGIVAMAGPTWRIEPSPLAEQRSAQVIVVSLQDSMLGQDIAPSRLQRAVHKVHDLLQLRPGSPTALIVYAGSAHRVIPLTTDHQLIVQFADELTPDMMPVPGDEPMQALRMADQLLADSGQTGSILMLTDHLFAETLAPTQAPVALLTLAVRADAEPAQNGGPPVPALDVAEVQRAVDVLEAHWVEVSISDEDVQSIAHRFDRRLGQAQASLGDRWQDAGYWLLWPMAAFLLLGFRRGWGLRWQT